MSGAINVMFFASLREDVGVDQLQVDADNISSLLSRLAEVLDAQALASLREQNVRIAVNQAIIEGDTDLLPGDEVAFLPPVTGG